MAKKKAPQRVLNKLGDDRHALAVKPRKVKSKKKTSRDVREDRGTRQNKMGKRR